MSSNAFAERLKGQLEPTAGGSIYVDPAKVEWEPSQFAGIRMKVLYRNDAAGEMTVLLKWEPGACLPFHKHPEIEQSWVLEGVVLRSRWHLSRRAIRLAAARIDA